MSCHSVTDALMLTKVGILGGKVMIPTCASLFSAGLHVPYRGDRMEELTVTTVLASRVRRLAPLLCTSLQKHV